MIDLMPNETFFIQLGIFLFTLMGLNFLVFKPILRLIAYRKEVTEGSREEAKRLSEATGKMVEQYEGQIKEAREEGLGEKGRLTQEGEKEAQDIMDQAREDIEESLEKSRKVVQQESKEAQLSLRNVSREMSEEMAEKLLGRKVSA